MKTDLSPDTDVSLLPRADLPVIWDAFKAKAEAVRATAETLTVTCITQKDEMALARTTRLTLREIRIAVENKRVELGESHLKEIKKVNGAANAIKEFIQPLEARLLVQEEFGERAEAARIAELSKSRTAEVHSIWSGCPGDFGKMSETDYAALIARLRSEKAEIEEANRLRIEAERKLAEQAIEMRRQEEAFLEKLQAEKVAENARLAAEREEQKLRDTEAERVRFEQEAKHRAELSAASAIRTLEREAEEKRRQEDLRIEREKTAALEAQIASAALDASRAVALEEKRLRDLAVAPDVEKLWQFAIALRGIQVPGMVTPEGISFAASIYRDIHSLATSIEETCKSWGLTKV